MNFLTTGDIAFISGVRCSSFDTWSRNITVYKEPLKIPLPSPPSPALFGFGDSSQSQALFELQDVTGVFPAVVRLGPAGPTDTLYFNSEMSAYLRGEFHAFIKVKQDCYDFINNGLTQKVGIDARFYLVDSDGKAQTYQGSTVLHLWIKGHGIMTSISLKFNEAAFLKKFQKAVEGPRFKSEAFRRVNGVFLRAKAAMLKQFNEHNVTQEIEGGPDGTLNISGTLDGYGNLFSFIGFYADDKPTEPIRELLEATEVKSTVARQGRHYFRVTVPNKEDIFAITPMPWEEGNSWAEGIEKGISGLSYYFYKHWDSARSEEGFQAPYENQDDLVFSPTPYMSQILADFRDRMNESKFGNSISNR